MAVRAGAVGLDETLEQSLLLFRRNAAAGIGDADGEPDIARAVCVRVGACIGRRARGVRSSCPHLDTDASLFGEFDGVARQIEYDLPQPCGIAGQQPRQGGIDLDVQA